MLRNAVTDYATFNYLPKHLRVTDRGMQLYMVSVL
jgi:hypothetical protein